MKRTFWFALLGLLLLTVLTNPAMAQSGPDDSPPFSAYFPMVYQNAYLCTAIPTMISPAPDASLNTITPTFQWRMDEDETIRNVHFYLAESPDFTSLTYSTTQVYHPGETEFRITSNLVPNAMYHWRIRVQCKNGDYGPATSPWAFTAGANGDLPAMPTHLQPANGSTTSHTTVSMRWSAVPDATQYLLHVKNINSRGSIYRWVTGTSIELNLAAGATYEWWINAVNDYGIGPTTEKWRFSTPSNATTRPIP
jgi:hypothetical protein